MARAASDPAEMDVAMMDTDDAAPKQDLKARLEEGSLAEVAEVVGALKRSAGAAGEAVCNAVRALDAEMVCAKAKDYDVIASLKRVRKGCIAVSAEMKVYRERLNSLRIALEVKNKKKSKKRA